jgi:hypothetical protein
MAHGRELPPEEEATAMTLEANMPDGGGTGGPR